MMSDFQIPNIYNIHFNYFFKIEYSQLSSEYIISSKNNKINFELFKQVKIIPFQNCWN